MADVNKPKLQLRSPLPVNGDKTPSPATKLLINHGRPNFTIQRSAKIQNGNVNPTSPVPGNIYNIQNNNKGFVVRSTTFNGAFKPSNISFAAKQTLPKYGNTLPINGTGNEATKVVLRRARFIQTDTKEAKDDENVPEFIRRQRRIQERLANQNILDFENRRSGYFTQVLISPTSPNRQSFVETMASPAVKPGLEIPPPQPQTEGKCEATITKEQDLEKQQQQEVENSKVTVILNGQVEEEEVAKAIEEVNKAVEGEDDDKTELEEYAKSSQEDSEQNTETIVVATTIIEPTEETNPKNEETQPEIEVLEKPCLEATTPFASEVTKQQKSQGNDCTHIEFTSSPLIEDDIEIEKPVSNSTLEEERLQNGLFNVDTSNDGITISHTNGLNGPRLPTPDPKGEKGVNFETKTVVSFSQELGNNDNKYPDTVKVVKDSETSEVDCELKELTKLKFEIKNNDQDIEVNPILANGIA